MSAFADGLAAYRAGAHFEAHEHWETLWRAEARGPRREYLQALIQVAAAMHQQRVKQSSAAALRLLARARARLEALPAVDWELSIPALLAALTVAVAAIEAGASEDRTLVTL